MPDRADKTHPPQDAERYGADIDTLYEEELRALRAEGRRGKAPTPTGNLCRKCVPLVLNKPSGRRLCHSLTCPDKPGVPISVAEYAVGRVWERGR